MGNYNTDYELVLTESRSSGLNEQDDFDATLQVWLRGAQKIVDQDMARYPEQYKELVLMPGQRYVRVVANYGFKGGDAPQRSAWAFIDRSTGDVLKPDGWKRPAKHARGNIFDAQGGLGSVGPYGPAYLK